MPALDFDFGDDIAKCHELMKTKREEVRACEVLKSVTPRSRVSANLDHLQESTIRATTADVLQQHADCGRHLARVLHRTRTRVTLIESDATQLGAHLGESVVNVRTWPWG